jgi:ankyrin repeat protein
VEVCRVLLEHKEGLNCLTIKERQGYLPIHLAATSTIEILGLLVETTTDIDVTGDQEDSEAHQSTALSEACGTEQLLPDTRENNEAIIQTLLDASADPNKDVGMGRTPVLIAISSGNLAAAKVMLDNGLVDLNLAENLTPIVLAVIAMDDSEV